MGTSQRDSAAAPSSSRCGQAWTQGVDRDELTIHDVVRHVGVTSRTLRHYQQRGLLAPSSIGPGGVRHYDADALVRLQRILLLRGLGLSLATIGEVLDGGQDDLVALGAHIELLEQERARIDRQIAAVRATITAREAGEPIMARQMFDGFDHTQHEAEVTRRWGKAAYQRSDAWWRGLGEDGKQGFLDAQRQIASDFVAAFEAGHAPDDDDVQEIAARHHQWVASAAGTVSREYFTGLGQLYVDDERFGQHYRPAGAGGAAGPEFVRDAMAAYADRHLDPA